MGLRTAGVGWAVVNTAARQEARKQSCRAVAVIMRLLSQPRHTAGMLPYMGVPPCCVPGDTKGLLSGVLGHCVYRVLLPC